VKVRIACPPALEEADLITYLTKILSRKFGQWLVYRFRHMTSLSRREFTASLLAAASITRLAAQQKPEGRRAAAVPPTSDSADTLAMLTLAEAAGRLKAGTATSVELVNACLARIDVYNPKINAFITVTRDGALAQAKTLDAERRAGKTRGALHGIPIALKDNIDTAGVRTTAASAVYDDRVPTEDADVARRLSAAGAILIGKTNLHEFAAGGTSATSYFGPVRNPWALDRNPGGSSGGSAAAVATGLCYAALGTDTGGSIRTPSSYCSVVGLKPTYGLVSIRGIIPLTLSLDHCGPIARTTMDVAMMLTAMAGYDRLDIASVEHAEEDYVAALKEPVSGLRVGIARAPFFDLLDSDVASSMDDALRVLGKLTKSMTDTLLPSTRDISLGPEMYAYHEEMFGRLSGRYQIPTRRALQGGANLKAGEYVRARWRLELLRRTIDDAFKDVDVVVLPTRRHTPRTVDASIKREETDTPRNPELENTGAFNIYGIPAISVPCGFTSKGLPVGLMIAGPRFSEGRVLALAHAFEQATDFHTKRPPIRPDTPVPPLVRTEDEGKG
jgi:aspartyl-tRNA(Asn)/glutamyl-tRNA(Gln) amidotransferase subunit A